MENSVRTWVDKKYSKSISWSFKSQLAREYFETQLYYSLKFYNLFVSDLLLCLSNQRNRNLTITSIWRHFLQEIFVYHYSVFYLLSLLPGLELAME